MPLIEGVFADYHRGCTVANVPMGNIVGTLYGMGIVLYDRLVQRVAVIVGADDTDTTTKNALDKYVGLLLPHDAPISIVPIHKWRCVQHHPQDTASLETWPLTAMDRPRRPPAPSADKIAWDEKYKELARRSNRLLQWVVGLNMQDFPRSVQKEREEFFRAMAEVLDPEHGKK